MEKTKNEYSVEDMEDIIIDNPKGQQINSAQSMTPEEHKTIGSTPIEKIRGRENIINYIKKNLRALQGMQKLSREEINLSKKSKTNDLIQRLTDNLNSDIEYFAKEENTTTSDLLREADDIDTDD